LAGLLSEKGIHAGHIVALMIERSLEMIIGILGILKVGAAYLPIDPGYPQERIDYMLKDSSAKLLAGANELEGEKVRRWEGEKVLLESIYDSNHLKRCPRSGLHHSSLIIQHSNHLCYIIYTSGTTGRPKGVMIEHRNVVRLFFNDRCLFDFNCTDVWSMFHSYCFDFSVWEMYGALLFGGKLIIIPKNTARDPQAFREVLYKNDVTVLNQTPSAFYNLINEELKYTNRALHLRYVIFGGEALAPDKLKKWWEKYPNIKLINMFGITETTVHVTYKEITGREIDAGTSCIGKPIPTLAAYLFDGRLKLVPVGVTGELYIGGSGVGRGYLNRPELSHEKFIGNPYRTNERLYKSGDLARLSVHGELEYRGRIDRQVQVHGHRVEAGEIESRLLKHEDIQDAVVTANQDKEGHTFLTAYIVSRCARAVSQLREYLANKLPAYMIPLYFIPIPRIPLTANGKIDTAKLPLPGATVGEEYTAARDHIEQALVEAWREVLSSDKISIHDNFFNTGGDSIKAIRLLNAVNNRLQTNIKLLDIFTHSTPAELAAAIKKGTAVSQDKELAEAENEIAAFKT
ncbi:MAG: amino acid adenylation domain-containing protein, partial [Acidobacteria bacterium]|nr:amino acid adenylation domain-containing protein [Acidobacteriota bacterium]